MAQDHTDGKREAALMAPESYRRGTILSSPVEEAKKSSQGRRMVKDRILAKGKDSVYNMTGLVRTFPLDPEDLPGLENQFTFYAYFMGEAEELAVREVGGHPAQHGAVLCNRVTSATLGIMLGVLERGDRVLSVVQKGRSHPSVQQAVELVGAEFYEVVGVDAVEGAIADRPWRMLVITPLTPSKYHIPADDVRRAIALAKDAGMVVYSDDAHMISRSVFFDEPRTFEVGDVDISVWSIDKHVPGPRGAAIVARQDLMEKIQAQVFQFGLEAQSGHYVAMLRGMEALDTSKVEEASELAREAYRRFKDRYGDRVYQAGPGIAFSAEDFTDEVLERAGDRPTPLVADETAVTGAFVLMRDYGVITIPITGYPGAAPTFRLMMHPDGGRFGLDRLEEAVEATIDATAELVHQPDEVKRLLLGND